MAIKEKRSRIDSRVTDPHWLRLASILNAAVPKLKCPACGSVAFELLVPPGTKHSTIKTIYKNTELSAPEEMSFFDTVSVNCHDCGFVLEFIEQALKEKAERAGWKEPSNG